MLIRLMPVVSEPWLQTQTYQCSCWREVTSPPRVHQSQENCWTWRNKTFLVVTVVIWWRSLLPWHQAVKLPLLLNSEVSAAFQQRIARGWACSERNLELQRQKMRNLNSLGSLEDVQELQHLCRRGQDFWLPTKIFPDQPHLRVFFIKIFYLVQIQSKRYLLRGSCNLKTQNGWSKRGSELLCSPGALPQGAEANCTGLGGCTSLATWTLQGFIQHHWDIFPSLPIQFPSGNSPWERGLGRNSTATSQLSLPTGWLKIKMPGGALEREIQPGLSRWGQQWGFSPFFPIYPIFPTGNLAQWMQQNWTHSHPPTVIRGWGF